MRAFFSSVHVPFFWPNLRRACENRAQQYLSVVSLGTDSGRLPKREKFIGLDCAGIVEVELGKNLEMSVAHVVSPCYGTEHEYEHKAQPFSMPGTSSSPMRTASRQRHDGFVTRGS